MPFKGTIQKLNVLLGQHKSVTVDDTRALSYFPSWAQQDHKNERIHLKCCQKLQGLHFHTVTPKTLSYYLDPGKDSTMQCLSTSVHSKKFD